MDAFAAHMAGLEASAAWTMIAHGSTARSAAAGTVAMAPVGAITGFAAPDAGGMYERYTVALCAAAKAYSVFCTFRAAAVRSATRA